MAIALLIISHTSLEVKGYWPKERLTNRAPSILQISKTRHIISGMKPNQPDPTVRENRDAMPSWCGIFVFWALNKAGLPMPKWTLGKAPLNIASAYPRGYAPRPGDIAYRDKFSHFAMVEKTEGTDVYTVNGNTAGENNLGGQIQVKKHALKDWTAFFDPLYGIDPNMVSAPATAATAQNPSTSCSRNCLAAVYNAMEEAGEEMTTESSSGELNQHSNQTRHGHTGSQRSRQTASALHQLSLPYKPNRSRPADAGYGNCRKRKDRSIERTGASTRFAPDDGYQGGQPVPESMANTGGGDIIQCSLPR